MARFLNRLRLERQSSTTGRGHTTTVYGHSHWQSMQEDTTSYIITQSDNCQDKKLRSIERTAFAWALFSQIPI